MFIKKYNFSASYPLIAILLFTSVMVVVGDFFPLFENETYSRIKNTLEVWSNSPINEHLFLGYTRGLDDQSYASWGYFYALIFGLYQFVFENIFNNLGQWSTLWLFISSYIYFSFNVIFDINLCGYKEKVVLYLLILFLFLSQGYILATYYVVHDNFYPFTGLLTAILTINYLRFQDGNNKLILKNLTLFLLAIFGHIAGLIALILHGFFLQSFISKTKAFVLVIVSLANITLPYLLVKNHRGSSFLYRSGLDGDRTYFSNHFQAVFLPYDVDFPRWVSVLSTVILILILWGVFRFKLTFESIKNSAIFFILSTVGYLTNVVIFPQSVSIHPYLYDFLWIVPMHFTALYMLSQSQQIAIPGFFSGRFFTAFFLIATFLMINLIAITTFVKFQ